MTDEAGQAFVEYLLDRAGDKVRSIASYTATDSEVLYLREDVGEEYTIQRLESGIEEYRRENAKSELIEHLHAAHGDLRCVVRSFDDGVELHLMTGDEEGVITGLESSMVPNLRGFIDECFERLGSPK